MSAPSTHQLASTSFTAMQRLLSLSLIGLPLLALPTPAAAQSKEFAVTQGSAPKDPTNKLPLKTTRIVRFTTDEGSWLSVDLSPDGRTILFDLLGDLYTLPVTGG